MVRKDIIMATQRELRKLHLVKKVIEGVISQVEAAEQLSMSSRQIRRMAIRVIEEGDEGILHRSRGQRSNRALPSELRQGVIELYKSRYCDFGPTFFAEKLAEQEDIVLSDETIRKWLISAGLWQKTKKRPKHRQWRQRRSQRGHLIQIDGSHHDWLEGRGPWCVLMAYIDDATNEVYARFYPYEGTIPAMDSFLRYIRKNGLPLSVYVDKHTTYKSPGSKADIFEDQKLLSQFERAMEELAVEVIHAHSPQAKGRIERLFKTLQDRLVKEMRLAGISTMEAANEFLKTYLVRHNRKFARKAEEKEDMHRKVLPVNLKRILCIKTERTVRNDYTISHDGQFYQIIKPFKQKKVTVEERVNGTMEILIGDDLLPYKRIDARPEKPKVEPKLKIRKPVPPASNHPWKQSYKRKEIEKQQLKKPVPWVLL